MGLVLMSSKIGCKGVVDTLPCAPDVESVVSLRHDNDLHAS